MFPTGATTTGLTIDAMFTQSSGVSGVVLRQVIQVRCSHLGERSMQVCAIERRFRDGDR